MGIKTTIGGDRLGSGKKMRTELHNYGRSTFNLSENFISTMAAGTLVPFYQNIGLNGDTFDFDLSTMVRTIPTSGPLFGSFKFQADLFVIPIRLYNGVLHNNPLNVGLNMSQVKLPVFEFKHKTNNDTSRNIDPNLRQVAKNALLRYLGISGIAAGNGTVKGKFSALGVLSYMDIFKNYYANKQEEKAYQIVAGRESNFQPKINEVLMSGGINVIRVNDYEIAIEGDSPDYEYCVMNIWFKEQPKFNNVIFQGRLNGQEINNKKLNEIDDNILTHYHWMGKSERGYGLTVTWAPETTFADFYIISQNVIDFDADISIKPFNLSAIDDMREKILKFTRTGEAFNLSNYTGMPYETLWKVTPNEQKSFNSFDMNGLLVKTYQSDIFNAFMNSETGIGGTLISNITKVDVSDGYLKLDAFNLATKVYNLLNRISAMGGTYDDWQEAVYGETAMRRAESPIYCGGISTEIVFEEIVATSESTADGLQKLGALAGKGIAVNHKGGKVTIKVREPSIIMGICSITPRLVYSQGNAWYNYKLESMDDLHKPALDGIGFEDLNGYSMAWFSRFYDPVLGVNHDHYYGKVPAWINYQTAVDKAYGDFIDENAASYMVLDRHYAPTQENMQIGGIKDVTTYIDPQKFNIPFAYQGLESQNFWTQIGMKITARRIMSAKVIPNL